MLGSAFKIGRLFGIKITLSTSFLVLMVLWGVTQSLAHNVVEGLVHSTLSLGLIFGSVLLHELGHSLVARRYGVDVAEIELHFFGGTAKMLSMPKRPRDEVVIATKVSGNNPGWVREGRGYDGAVIREAVETSLKRLQTDVIDLYQMHWPIRGSYMFRQNWTYDPSGQNRQQTMDHMMDVLEALGDMVKAGKIRSIGMSNESAWGMTKWIDQAEAAGLPRMASVQNEYSLLCRLYDTDMAEMAVNEDVTLLSFSPLACGVLTGKYQNGAVPGGSRLSLNGDLGGRVTDRLWPTAQAYLDLAAKHGLDPVHMAMAWQRTRPFAVSAIFGATTSAQLTQILDGKDVVLSDEVIAEIDAVHKQHPMPY